LYINVILESISPTNVHYVQKRQHKVMEEGQP
jgi:hypothetical protein